MGTKYTTTGRTGFDSNPPPDNGSTGDDNKVTWSKHKSKLALPIADQVDAIDTKLVDQADVGTSAKSGAYSTVADDNGRAIECTLSPTITLGAAATMGSGYTVTVKCVSGTTTVATDEQIDGSASNRTISAGSAETYRVNSDGDKYLITSIDTGGVITTRGDVIRGSSSGTAERLAVGSSGEVLTTDGTDVSWGSLGLTITAGSGGSAERALNTTGVASSAHGFSALPDLVVAVIEATGTNLGYTSGDQVTIGTLENHDTGSTPSGGVAAYADATNVYALSDGTVSDGIWIPHATTGVLTQLSTLSWKIVATAYKFA